MASALSPAPVSPPSFLSAVPAPEHEPSTRLLIGLLLVAALVPRLVVFPVNENRYGDSVVRTELAERWLGAPHLIESFQDGALQFGPLHIYLVGAALTVLEREHAGRAVSLLFGVLSVVPLFVLTRRFFGWRAGVWAGLAFSVWGMHLQFSTTAGSEAVSLFFMLCVFALYGQALEERRFGPIFGAAMLLNLACALRYDAWLYIPLLALLPMLWARDRIAATTLAVAFGLLCLPFPLLWMQGNELAHSDPFYPIKFIDEFHRDWVANSTVGWRQWWFRVQSLFFWPGTAVLTLTPGVALLGMVGMVRAWRQRPETRWLVLAALVPAVFYTFRAAVLTNFVPLGRFAVTQIVLLLPFVAYGFSGWVGEWGPRARQVVAGITVALAVLMPVALGLYTFRADGGVREVLRPISPTSTNLQPVMGAARFLKEEVAAKGGAVVLDSDASFQDLQLGFFSGLPDERVVRLRWPDFRAQLETVRPEYLVRFDEGGLVREPGVTLEGRTLTLGGVAYEELEGFAPPVHVYRRR
ncbi:ArnT family glycosyltransferase [Hyalangium rubrum]|uniref:Glycosyltransferase family 39 protein n=1 Tax=Hyalangium rubrum TaxID=3103134 RepID=A0ABU5H5P9_9BACT|nr:glycosyltransferase family 39 protein [Hyalangium sp. s54d21]MDY7228414.1 glycosyltransferase family 39 protein [Hyalangium sp. s54d21]